MTIDITFCTGKYCDKKETCYRWTALLELRKTESTWPISMMQRMDDGKECDLYWERKIVKVKRKKIKSTEAEKGIDS